MEGVILGLIRGGDDIDKKRWNDVRRTKSLPQPLPEEGGEWLVVEMEGVILGLIRGGDDVDKKRWNDVRQIKPHPQPLSEERGE